MSQAEQLLMQLTEALPEHNHSVVDSDTYFIIDPISRSISNTASNKNVLMQFDDESEVFTFEIPRYVEGHDMLLCDTVYIHWNNIDSEKGESNIDIHQATDLELNPENENSVICKWVIKKQSTLLAGSLVFLLEYACHDENGNKTYSWHTDLYKSIQIKKGLDNGSAITVEYSDLLEEWYKKLFSSGIYNITGEVGQIIKIAAVDEKGAPTEWETVNIPEAISDEEYTLLTQALDSEVTEA